MNEPSRPPGPSTHFGFDSVPVEEKGRRVRAVFESVAGRYDLMNDLMSGGIHRLWKAEFLAAVAPRPGERLLDVAGGTGDIAVGLLQAAGGTSAGTKAAVVDLTPEMVAAGRDRALDHGIIAGIDWIVGDGECLPIADRSVDVYTIAFGLRNVTRIDAALSEACRVLRPGGRFYCLEFSRVVVPPLAWLYDAYSFNVLPELGRLVAGNRDAYRYLVESIRRFPAQAELAAMITTAGLDRVRYRNLSGGIAAIHWAWRL